MLLRLAAAVAILSGASLVALRPAATLPLTRPVAAPDRIWAPPGRPFRLDGGSEGPVLSLLNVPRPMHYGQYVWRDRGVPPGPVWVRVDRRAQILSVFRGGHEIGTAVILYGANAKPTPGGRFPVLTKERMHRSNTYDADMPFALRLTRDGVFVHASKVRDGAATHGCIGVPEDFARRLFDQVRAGDVVVVV